MNKIPLKSYFGKDWKFFWRQETVVGNWYGALLNRIGMIMLKRARILLRKGGGTFKGRYYSNCSWCGDRGIRNGGLNHGYSKKGSRCLTTDNCQEQPKV